MQAPPTQQMGVLAPYEGPVDANPVIDSRTAQLLGNMVGITVRQKVRPLGAYYNISRSPTFEMA